ncbi:MAG: transposase [Kouleothrix sp.]
MPIARALVASLASAPLTLLLDGTVAGRGCVVLMASVVSHGRAIPLRWTVVKGKKGHLPQAAHCTLINQVRTIIPVGATVLVLGDGEFDGTDLQATITAAGWQYVCRTAINILITAHDRVFTVGALPIRRGAAVALTEVQMTAERYGPVSVIAVWDAAYAQPLYLITSLADAVVAIERYRLRFRIECMFADHKSRGFHIRQSHLADPARLGRLLIATSLAYLWVHRSRALCPEQDWVRRFHRTDRCDLSLFQIGLRALRYAQRESGCHTKSGRTLAYHARRITHYKAKNVVRNV